MANNAPTATTTRVAGSGVLSIEAAHGRKSTSKATTTMPISAPAIATITTSRMVNATRGPNPRAVVIVAVDRLLEQVGHGVRLTEVRASLIGPALRSPLAPALPVLAPKRYLRRCAGPRRR
jgi:hypothetical protein